MLFLEIIGILLLLVFFFGITILVHEFGHYLAARLLGFTVETFSIGFGPSLWKIKRKGIVYKIGAIPFGGYVSVPQLDPAAMSRIQTAGKTEAGTNGPANGTAAPPSLPIMPPWKKIVVSLAGAAGNILLAILLAWIVYGVGIPATPAERSAAVGYVAEESEAYEQGLRMGDTILSVNDRPVENWQEVRMETALTRTAELVAHSPEGERKTIVVETEKGAMGEQRVPGVSGRDTCMALRTVPGSPAKQAGIKPGDVIVAFAGQEVLSMAHMIALVEEYRDRQTTVTVRRPNGDEIDLKTFEITPRYDEEEERTLIGIQFNMHAVDHDTIIRPTPREQLAHHASAIFRVLRALTTRGEARAAQGAVGGPVAVILSYWYIVRASVMLAVWFTGFLNVNLAIINLLPIPVLDGGHIVFSLWELITRRPVKTWVVEVLVNICMALLLMLLVFLSIRDVDRMTEMGTRIRRLFRSDASAPAVEAPAVQREPTADNSGNDRQP